VKRRVGRDGFARRVRWQGWKASGFGRTDPSGSGRTTGSSDFGENEALAVRRL